jgi:fermentation-respiration switch protein FrsA (DUF1100 family)
MSEDSVTPAYHSEDAHAKAPEPKKLVKLEGTHYDIHGTYREEVIGKTIDWFTTHL